MKLQVAKKVYTEVQKAFNEGYTSISAQGSSRSGKTYNIMIWIIIYCLQHKGTSAVVARCTLPTAKDTVFEDMLSILRKMEIFKEKSMNRTLMIYTFNNGSTIKFKGAEDPQKLHGKAPDIMYFNEANEILEASMFQLNMRTKILTICDYNPSFSEEHWLNAFNALPTTYHFITTYKDNPFLEQRVIDEIESLQWKNPSLWQIYGLGQRAIVEGLVFKKFETVKEFPSFVKKRWVGVDFGFTADPTAVVLVGQFENDLYIKEIAYQKNLLSRDIAQILCKGNLKHLPIICDSADPRLRKEIINVGRDVYRTDLEIIPVKKGNSNSIMPSLDKMTLYNIKITENSLNVIKEFRNYTYVQDREGNWLNKPIEKFNHAIDATRYVVMTKLLGQKKHRGIRTYR